VRHLACVRWFRRDARTGGQDAHPTRCTSLLLSLRLFDFGRVGIRDFLPSPAMDHSAEPLVHCRIFDRPFVRPRKRTEIRGKAVSCTKMALPRGGVTSTAPETPFPHGGMSALLRKSRFPRRGVPPPARLRAFPRRGMADLARKPRFPRCEVSDHAPDAPFPRRAACSLARGTLPRRFFHRFSLGRGVPWRRNDQLAAGEWPRRP